MLQGSFSLQSCKVSTPFNKPSTAVLVLLAGWQYSQRTWCFCFYFERNIKLALYRIPKMLIIKFLQDRSCSLVRVENQHPSQHWGGVLSFIYYLLEDSTLNRAVCKQICKQGLEASFLLGLLHSKAEWTQPSQSPLVLTLWAKTTSTGNAAEHLSY